MRFQRLFYRGKRRKQSQLNKKMIAGIAALSTVAVFGTGVAFAGTDIQGQLASWYKHKAEKAIAAIELAVNSEADINKDRLREAIKQKLTESAKDLDEYTEGQKRSHIEAVRAYADRIINGLSFSNEDDKKQVRTKLNKILKLAEQAMDDIEEDYRRPKEEKSDRPAEQGQDKGQGQGQDQGQDQGQGQGQAKKDGQVKENQPQDENQPKHDNQSKHDHQPNGNGGQDINDVPNPVPVDTLGAKQGGDKGQGQANGKSNNDQHTDAPAADLTQTQEQARVEQPVAEQPVAEQPVAEQPHVDKVGEKAKDTADIPTNASTQEGNGQGKGKEDQANNDGEQAESQKPSEADAKGKNK